jgi:hypothetical protein
MSTSYQQQKRYLQLHKKDADSCPQTKFREDLIQALNTWRAAGDRLIVCLDANEHVYRKSIGKALTAADGLAMKEVVGTFTGQQIGATFFRGSTPIDAIWATLDITVCNAVIMPTGYGIGDHRLFVIDFLARDVIGTMAQRAVRLPSRWLNTTIPKAAERYAKILEEKVIQHRLIERVGKVYSDNLPREETQQKMKPIDEELGNYMTHASNNCRKIKSGVIPFSPESVIWIERAQIYRSLLRYHEGKIRNIGNLKQRARKHYIYDATSISVD